MGWFITYLRDLQPAYIGVIIHLVSTMDIPVENGILCRVSHWRQWCLETWGETSRTTCYALEMLGSLVSSHQTKPIYQRKFQGAPTQNIHARYLTWTVWAMVEIPIPRLLPIQLPFQNPFEEQDWYPIASMGLIYSPTFTIKISHSCRWIYQSHGSFGSWRDFETISGIQESQQTTETS